MADNKTKVYQFWNGKNIDGKSSAELTELTNASKDENNTEMNYEVGVDTISADDLQKDISYTE